MSFFVLQQWLSIKSVATSYVNVQGFKGMLYTQVSRWIFSFGAAGSVSWSMYSAGLYRTTDGIEFKDSFWGQILGNEASEWLDLEPHDDTSPLIS